MPVSKPSYGDRVPRRQIAANMQARITELEAEVERLRALAQEVLDALDAEKTPDYGQGHDRAHRAALAMLGLEPKRIEGRNVPLGEIRRNA